MIQRRALKNGQVRAEVIYLAATTGARRGELCALRRCSFDEEQRALTISRTIVKQQGSKVERPTKNRKTRAIGLDARSVTILSCRLDALTSNAQAVGVTLTDDPYLFAIDARGTDPWDPDTITQYFGRLRTRMDLPHIDFKGLRRFMDTYGQALGFDRAQVSMRAGHDPAVAGRHYTGRVTDIDRQIADAVAGLLHSDRLDNTDS